MRLSSRLATGVALAAIAVTPSAAHAATNGPDPTVSSLRASAGPYSLSRNVYADSATPGFGTGSLLRRS